MSNQFAASSNGFAKAMRSESQTTVHPWSIHRNTPKICFEFALISDI